MKKITTFISLSILPIFLFSQSLKKQLTNGKFELLYTNKTCIYDPNLDKSRLWETKKGKKFLINKLNTATNKGYCIALLSRAVIDARIVKALSPYIEGDNPDFFNPSINAIIKSKSKRSTKILENNLSNLDENNSEKASALIRALSLKGATSSIEVLDTFSSKLDDTNVELLIKIDQAKRDIVVFNSSFKEAEALIRSKLFSNEAAKINWCISKLYFEQDSRFLPVVKDFYSNNGSNEKKFQSVHLRERLGDTDFTEDEKAYILSRKQIKLDNRNRTIEYLKKRRNYSDF